MEPSQSDVDNFLAFCDAVTGSAPERALAIRYIKDADGNLDRAISNYEQDPNRYAADRYDETLFSQDRDGGSNQYAGVPSFQIDHVNDSLAQYPQSTAATRPNTPSNSMHDSGMGDSQLLDASAGQETGVVGGSGVQFGPATREYYEQNQWALTVANTVPDPAPSQRKREPGEPAFIKPLPSQDYLPSLVTILGTIPVSHNALLLSDCVLPNYGRDPQWWSGTPITLPQTIDLDNPQQQDARMDIVHETQRIMAFLDYTERSYGSVEALTKIETPWNIEGDTEAVKFLEAWHNAASNISPEAGFDRLFQTTAYEAREGDAPSTPSFKCLSPTLSNRGDEPPMSLYDVLDDTVWANDPDGSKEVEASISSVADVLVMVVKQPDANATGLNMNIPVSWYVDRYLTEHARRAKQMRKDRAECKSRIAQMQQKAQKLSRFTYNGRTGDALLLLEEAMSIFKLEDGDSRGDGQSFPVASRDSKLLHQLQNVYDHVKGKLDVLKSEENKARKAYDELSNLLKEPSDNTEASPKAKYQLCGVSTDPAVTYIKNGNKSNFGERMDETIASGDANAAQSAQDWWRIHYDSSGQISKSRISEADVLTAAAMENRDVLLVYASARTLVQPFDDVPQALAEFVSSDNMLFREELAQDTEQPPPYGADAGGSDGDSGFANASAKEWYGEQQQQQQPEMAEKGSGLVAEIASAVQQTADADAVMADAGGVQHIEFADSK